MGRKIGVILSYISMIFEVLSTLLLTPYMIQTLGQAEFGVYKLSAAIIAYLLLLDLGVGNAIIRYISKYRAENDIINERKFFAVAIIFYAIIGLLSLIGGFVLSDYFPVFFAVGLTDFEILLGQKLLLITAVNCAFTLATSCYMNIILAYEKFAVVKGASIISVILKMIVMYLVLKAGMGSLGVVTVTLFLTIVTRSYMVWYVFSRIKLRPLFNGIDTSFMKGIIVYSALIFLQMIATQINATVGQILLGHMVLSSAAIIGVYGIGTQIVQYFQSIGSAFNGVLMPGVVRMVSNKASSIEITNEMVRIGRIILMALMIIWICFVVNGKNFVVLWAGNENGPAFYVAVLLMFAYLIILTESVGSQVLWAMNKHREQALLKVFIVLMNIFITVFLIRWDPLLGVALGTFVSLLSGDILVMNYIFKKKFGMNIVYYYKKLLKGILPSAIFTLILGFGLANILPSDWTGFILKVLAMVISYTAFLYYYGMNAYEKNIVCSLLKIKEN